MEFRWETTRFRCRIEINVIPYLLSAIFIRIRVVIVKRRRFWYRQLFTVWDRPRCRWQSWMIHCVSGYGGDTSYVWKTKETTGCVFSYFPSNHGNGERHFAWTIYPTCGKPHTRYTTNTSGPAFIFVTHFKPKLKIISFLNERGKILPLGFEGHFTTHVTEGAVWFKLLFGMMKI